MDSQGPVEGRVSSFLYAKIKTVRMKRFLLLLATVISFAVHAGTITYYPKGSTPEQTQGLTEFYPVIPAQAVLIIAPGIGERNSGDLAGCKLSSGWGGWGNIKVNADKYGFILVFINTTHDYEYGEFQFALKWTKKKYPSLSNSVWVWGHSLGSYGAGKYAMKDTAFVSQIAGWVASASGDFTGYITTQYKNLVKYGVKVWGVTAANDVVSGTSPKPIRDLYTQMKAIDPKAYVIKTEFPSTEWPNDYPTTSPRGSKVAHNAVLGRLSQAPPYYSKGNLSLITFGIASNSVLKMNVYQWMLSNPRGSVYQDPTQVYIGPRSDTVFIATDPIPGTAPAPSTDTTAYYIKDVNYAIRGGFLAIQWTDGKSPQIVKPASGDAIVNVYDRVVNGQRVLTVDYAIAPNKTFGPKKP